MPRRMPRPRPSKPQEDISPSTPHLDTLRLLLADMRSWRSAGPGGQTVMAIDRWAAQLSDAIAKIDEDEYLTVGQAAKHLNVSRDIVYEMAATLGLKHWRVADRAALRFKKRWLDDWVEANALANVANQMRTALK